MATVGAPTVNLRERLERTALTHRAPFATGHMTWRRFGEGRPLVLLHGGHGSWWHWARNIECLAERYTVWVPDLPGYGDSDLPAGASLVDLVDATVESLDHLVGGGAPVSLAGFSFGALVAARMAERRGGVLRLALLGPGGHGGPRRPRGELRAWRGLAPHSAEWDAVMHHNLLMHMLHDPAAIDEVALRIHGEACLATRFHSKTISRAGGLATSLDRYSGHLLLAWGEHDVTLVPDIVANALEQSRLTCRTHTVPGAGHWVQYEAAQAVNELLASWLESTNL
jgi:pimeloyl-ACP methyl ester carboxylesterase